METALRRVGERHVPDLHRLHADDEGVRQHTQQQQSGGGTSNGRRASREVERVGHAGGRVEDQREQVHRAVGAK